MTSSCLDYYAEQFRTAIEAYDFSLAQTNLQRYVECFRSCSRTLPEIEDARNLLRCGVEATKARKAHLAEELMHLRRVFDAYVPPKRSHNWRLEG